ncbi:hypothetical protein [Asticcacaulis tiandongensis]|uniref:hypothetical protein n=1 Tax=Asticcacaulis tiandongensis TaxID=2565365 RepID=UPI00112E8F36|nr:hypothetical protein [Asticcacaulis tiandongensis]
MRKVNRQWRLWAGAMSGLICMSLGACASKPDRVNMVESHPVDAGDPKVEDDDASFTETVRKSAGDVRGGFSDAVSAPLVDLNLKRKEIPPVLLRAVANTYDLGGLYQCEEMAAEVRQLDAVLGPDFDEPPAPNEIDTYTERGGQMASKYTLDAVRGAATDIIPYRSVIRRLSGAEKHHRAYEKAVDAGHVRRAYLKGIGMHKNCAPPAAPSWFVPTAETVKAEVPAPAIPAPTKKPAPRKK